MSGFLQLRDTFKTYTYDQDKAQTPEETVAHVRQRFAEVDIDILDKTMRIDSGRLDIPVYISLCGTDAVVVTGTKKQMGKGGTPIQAEASALMELAERFSFFNFIKNTRFPVATYAEIGSNKLPMEMLWLALHDEDTDLKTAATVLNELPWGIDERGRVLGIVQFTNGVKAMGLIEADENGVKIGMKLKAGWKPVRVTGGERVYGLTFQPAE